MDIDELREALGNEFAFIFNEINPIIQNFLLEKEAKILDIGTGMGRMAIILALNGYKVITGEPESDQSEYAKQNWLESAKKVGVDHLITYTPFNAENMHFVDGDFDTIFILGALHHIDDKKAALKECVRVLKSSGIICIFEPNRDGIKFIREKKFPSHPDSIDPRPLAQMLSLAIEVRNLSFYDVFILKKGNLN